MPYIYLLAFIIECRCLFRPHPKAATGGVLKKTVLKNFALFTGKHLCWSIFLIRPATLLKRGTSTGVFLWIFRNF